MSAPLSQAGVPSPFFETSPHGAGARRMLLVTRSFPPDSNIGALRWQKLIEHAGTRGWAADVIMMDPAEADVHDDSRLANLPPGVRLFGVPLEDSFWVATERRLRGFVSGLRRSGAKSLPGPARAVSAATDQTEAASLVRAARALRREYLASIHYAQWSGWARRAAALGARLSESRSYHVVVSSGPPHIAHDAARRIAAATHRPLVLDFRDPWTTRVSVPRDLDGFVWKNLSAMYEKRCVERASLVAVTTPSNERDFVGTYPDLAGRVITVMNGADPEVKPSGAINPRFTIAQAGTLYGGRDPRILFRAVERLTRSLGLTPEQLRVHFIGDMHYMGQDLSDIAAEEGIPDFLVSEPARPRVEALRVLQGAAVLVLLPQEQVPNVPGKTFEYVQLSAWVLALTAPGSAVELLLRDTEAQVLRPDDLQGIERALATWYHAFSRGERPSPINSSGRFDRERYADTLFDAFERLAAGAGGLLPGEIRQAAGGSPLERSLP